MDLQRVPQNSATDRVVLPRRAFLRGLVGLIAAPAVVKADILMPIKVWPPIIWRKGRFNWDMLVCNGAELRVADFPELFEYLGYQHGGAGPFFRLPDRGNPGCERLMTHRKYVVISSTYMHRYDQFWFA